MLAILCHLEVEYGIVFVVHRVPFCNKKHWNRRVVEHHQGTHLCNTNENWFIWSGKCHVNIHLCGWTCCGWIHCTTPYTTSHNTIINSFDTGICRTWRVCNTYGYNGWIGCQWARVVTPSVVTPSVLGRDYSLSLQLVYSGYLCESTLNRVFETSIHFLYNTIALLGPKHQKSM